MRLLVSATLAANLSLVPNLAWGHGQSPQRASFTPAPDSMSFEDVVRACVQDIDPSQVPLQSGLGDVRYPLVALGPATERVRRFYSQGFTLFYGFNFPDAIQSFHRARSLDPGAPMPYWGIGVSANANINSTATQGCNRLSYRASQLAVRQSLARRNNPVARARYSLGQLNREVGYAEAFASLFEPEGAKVTITDATQRRYAARMKELAARFQDDLDAATNYANALLNVNPWKWWIGSASTSTDVRPTPEADTALQVLNTVLMQDTQHVGANHLYIHVIEASPFSDSGRAMAERLPKLVPAAGHLVHMASHIQQRIGDNAAASASNYAAVSVDRALANQKNKDSLYLLHYLGHNIHFLSWTLSIEGRRNESLNMAEELVQNTRVYASNPSLCLRFPEEIQVKSDYFFAVPFAFGSRFEAWEYVERMAGVIQTANAAINAACGAARADWQPLGMPFSGTLLAYARAYRALGEPGEAGLVGLRSYWSRVRTVVTANPSLQYGNNPALKLFRIANVILINRALSPGRSTAIPLETLRRDLTAAVGGSPAAPLGQDLAEAEGKPAQVVRELWRTGVALQDELNYNEPPDWLFTLREFQGYALLQQGLAAEAEKVFLADLKNNRGSGRSLAGLERSLRAQGKAVPEWVKTQLASAWANATVSASPAP